MTGETELLVTIPSGVMVSPQVDLYGQTTHLRLTGAPDRLQLLVDWLRQDAEKRGWV
jgi:hypothetical protein